MTTINNKLLKLEQEPKKTTLYKIYNVVFLMGVILVVVIVITLGRILFYGDGNPLENLVVVLFGKGGLLIAGILILRLGCKLIGFI